MSDSLLLNTILNSALERKASDIHLVAASNPVIRVEGKLITLNEQQVLTPDVLLGIAEGLLKKSDLEKLNSNKEVITIYNWPNRARFRVKIFFQKGFLALSFRIISTMIPSPKDLLLPSSIAQILQKEKGILIITGQFASGRTTTSFSLLEALNQTKGLHIQTLEDPIEILLSNNLSIIEQREVGRDTISFLQGLKDMQDEDVDIVMLSSLHEDGMEELILELAESGKIVLVIMDADSVVSAIDRFINNIDVDKREWARDVFSNVLLGVIAQKLLPRLGGGLILATEILTSTSAVRSMLKENKLAQLYSIMQTSRSEGMMTMQNSIDELLSNGLVDPKNIK